MCGLAGVISSNGVRPQHLRLMADAISHRGPDDEGFLLASDLGQTVTTRWGKDTIAACRIGEELHAPLATVPTVGIAFRRLAILDPTAAGHQPMSAADGRVWIAFNGEIYNYLEVRETLTRAGHKFRSNSDTEVLLHAYLEWGTDCLRHLNGMWAFALLDTRQSLLWLSRDRLGVKPLYLRATEDGFAFASEIKALLTTGRAPRQSARAVSQFLLYGVTDHEEQTFFEGIRSLPAGHSLMVHLGEPTTAPVPYWKLPAEHRQLPLGAFEQTANEVRARLREAVRIRLRSDVPVGFCLSGGLDSSTIVSLAASIIRTSPVEAVGASLRTFTAGVDDDALDERPRAQIVAEASGAHFETVTATADGYIADFDNMILAQDEPVGGPSVYLQFALMRAIGQAGVKVVLDGQGADELFGGYYRYPAALALQAALSGHLFSATRIAAWRGWRGAAHAGYQALLRTPAGRSVVDLMYPEHAWLDIEQVPDDHREFGILRERLAPEEMMRQDLTRWSLPRLLRYEDRNSMAFSIETRLPFADDLELIEYVSSLPAAILLRDGETKALLRHATRDLVPDAIRTRRTKLGFSTPEVAWAIAFLASSGGREFVARGTPYTTAAQLTDILRRVPHDTRAAALLWRLYELDRWAALRLNSVATREHLPSLR